MMKPWSSLLRTIDIQGIAAMVTVADLSGSGPREVGARMLVAGDGQISGTIGGGRLEWQALAEAQRMMADLEKTPTGKFYTLGPELGQCCGGAITLYFEIFDRKDIEFVRTASSLETECRNFTVKTKLLSHGAERAISDISNFKSGEFEQHSDGSLTARFTNDISQIWLFGAGHVGHALVNALAPLPFHLTWLDSRPNQFQDIERTNIDCIVSQDPVAALEQCPPGAFVIIMTHSHELDFDLCARALLANRFDYVGVIGSKTKAARFKLRLKSTGLDDNAIARLVSPLGVDTIKGKEPAMVAISITAQLLERRKAGQQASVDRHINIADKDNSAHG